MLEILVWHYYAIIRLYGYELILSELLYIYMYGLHLNFVRMKTSKRGVEKRIILGLRINLEVILKFMIFWRKKK